jgi:cytochrome P450
VTSVPTEVADLADSLPDDLLAPEAVRDPYSLLGALRSSSPVHWSRRHHAWILTRHDDVLTALSDERLSTDNIRPLQRRMTLPEQERFAPAAELLESWMLFTDPPLHTRLRAPVRSTFTPRAVERLRPRIVEIVEQLVRDAGQVFDFTSTVALPLPALAIAELLGIPASALDQVRDWSRMLGALVVGKVQDEAMWDKALAAAIGFTDLFTDLVHHYEAHPADNLITALLATRRDEEALTEAQVVGACTMLLFAGHETTTNLLSSGLLALLLRPEAHAALHADPSLVPTAVEEMVRFDGPAKVVVRRVREAHVLHGRRLEQGQPVYLAIAAANRDPAVFDHPDRFDIGRTPNRHLGFGWNRHFCLGAQLARLEVATVLEAVRSSIPTLQLACDSQELRWQANVVGRALRRLPVEVV